MIDPKLSGKVVLITGGNHGIGAATAHAFAAQGARVFITAYRPATPYTEDELAQASQKNMGGVLLYTAMQMQSPQRVVEDILSLGGIAAAWEADLGDPENIPRLFENCQQHIGAVDILVNNHTYCVLETFDPARVREEGFPVHLTSAESIDRHFMVNARGVALLMAEYVRRYLERKASWGRIINISTDAAHSHPENVSYAASKHAIESYSRSAAVELGKYGITINVVAPGPIQTGYIVPSLAEEITLNTPLGRVGEPEDVADVILFLASEQAHWLTGQLLYVGGGWRIGQ
jgi:3-oxoacyl-[acyl-carrier protein] reductase